MVKGKDESLILSFFFFAITWHLHYPQRSSDKDKEQDTDV